MKKIRLTEEQLLGIIERVISEQSDTPACNSWVDGTFKQGDGIKTPKITITKTPSLIEGLYEGPDAAGCIQRKDVLNTDTPHQLAGILVYNETPPYLKELYRNGTYVKPDMNNITMERVKNKSFKISIPLLSTTEDKAVTSMNRRGGMDHAGETAYIDELAKDPNHALVEIVTKKAGDMTEKFICFRNIKNFPIKTTPSNNDDEKTEENNKSEKIVLGDEDLLKLKQRFDWNFGGTSTKTKVLIENLEIYQEVSNYSDVRMIIDTYKTEKGYPKFFIFFSAADLEGEDLNKSQDLFLKQYDSSMGPKRIVREGIFNWLDTEFKYKIVGYN